MWGNPQPEAIGHTQTCLQPESGGPDIRADIANAFQVLEVLADDSNFRSMAMELSAAPAAHMLTLPAEAFESAWCAGEAATRADG